VASRGEKVELRDGSRVRIRPIGPADKGLLVAAFDDLSEESRYRRFLHPVKHLRPRDLVYFTEIDHHDHEALIALDAKDGEAVAVARYVRSEAEPEEAEVAIAVIDEWQGRGLGTELLVRLMRRARAEGLRRFSALMLNDNREVLELIEHVVPEISRRSSSGVLELVFDLPAQPHLLGIRS
jgi:GNAT superfamily N-acetyltransferase